MEGVWSMFNGNGLARLRALTLLAVMVLALGVAACGDDDDGNTSNAAQKSESTTVDNSPEGQIRSTYAGFIETFYGKDAKDVCERLTASARKRVGRGYKGCEQRFETFFKTANFGKNKPYVVKLRLDGPRALAFVKTKTSKQYPVPFQKENGEWKLDGGWSGQ